MKDVKPNILPSTVRIVHPISTPNPAPARAPAPAVAAARDPLPTYVLRGVDRTGIRRFYTGKKGADEWLTADPDGALPYQTKMGAQAKAKEFNDAHDGDLWFIVMQLPSTVREENKDAPC